MTTTISKKTKVSYIAENLIGSEIIRLSNEINEKIKKGEEVYNLTIGDFNPKIFPIPQALKQAIIDAYNNDETNYPAGNGELALRKAVSEFLKHYGSLDYTENEILISGGARPQIYATYKALVDPGDVVVYPVPSWNNNHYCHLAGAKQVVFETKAENNFMPTAEELKPLIKDANLLALCSPLNPTGTVFSKEQLEAICDMVLEENKRRGDNEKPLYLLFDQIYWILTLGDTQHYNPVVLRPEMKPYTVFIDGLSKAFAATGVRLGWTFGPAHIIDKMKAILSHVGAWAPKPEQIGTTTFLKDYTAIDTYLANFKQEIDYRLQAFYKLFISLKQKGYKVDAIAPQAAIYLTVQFDLVGKTTKDGKKLNDMKDVNEYILNTTGLGLVPFYAFGADSNSTWFRLSVGNSKKEDISIITEKLEKSLANLS